MDSRYSVPELARIAPWVYDEIVTTGADMIRSQLSAQGYDGDGAQPVATWVSALSRCQTDLWRALAQG